MSEYGRSLPKYIFFNPLSIMEAKPRHSGSYQIYARTHSHRGDAKYKLVEVLPELDKKP